MTTLSIVTNEVGSLDSVLHSLKIRTKASTKTLVKIDGKVAITNRDFVVSLSSFGLRWINSELLMFTKNPALGGPFLFIVTNKPFVYISCPVNFQGNAPGVSSLRY